MKNKKYLTLALIILGSFVAVSQVWSAARDRIRIEENKLYEVARVVDGDTFKIRTDKELVTVRLLGINTPETVDPRRDPECFGRESSNEMKDMLRSRQVWLDLDDGRETGDKFGRVLAYVYRDDGLFLNMHLLNAGFAREYTYGKPYSRQAEFRDAEKTAKIQKNGLWSGCDIKNK